MKKFRILILPLFIAQCAFGQYNTPGTGIHWNLNEVVNNSGGVMTFEEGKFLLWNELNVSENDTISIITDVEIRIEAGVEINVYGTLLCEPLTSLIIAAMDTTNNFKGLNFDNSDGSIMKRCKIEFGGGIKLINSDILMDSCFIRKNNQANSSGAIDMINSNPTIQNCRISENAGPAVLSAANGNSSPQMIGNLILQNCSSNLNMPQINLGTSSVDTIRIISNTITGLFENSGGIAVATLAGGSIKAIIEGNMIENNRYGITAYGMNIYTIIRDNMIVDNDIQGDPMLGGSGINFWGDQTNISFVSGNEISGNLWGITVQNQAKPNLGQVEPDTLNPGKNIFFENGNNGVIYALYNNTPNELFAENNYWGTYDPDTVEMYIFHQPDDPALGFVDYLPIKDYFTAISDQLNDKISRINVFPNPAKSTISLQFPDNIGSNENYPFQILDLYGRLIYSGNLSSPFQEIDISLLTKGAYTLLLTMESKSYSTLLIKQ